jgi:hypothetical protein
MKVDNFLYVYIGILIIIICRIFTVSYDYISYNHIKHNIIEITPSYLPFNDSSYDNTDYTFTGLEIKPEANNS